VVGVTVVVGVVVVVGNAVVAGVVVAAVTSPRAFGSALPLAATDGTPAAEVVAVPGSGAGARVVVVEVVAAGGSAFGAAFLPRPAGVACASRRCPMGLGWSEATAATSARSESATASTAHQCGRIRGGLEAADPDVLMSPPTG
jgi:hypothetical protein